jgi:hypothetical protein
MRKNMTESRKFHAIFCDDIRHEVTGKTSLIGCYSGVMYLPIFPATLSKLCVYTQLSTPIDQPFEGAISISVMKDEDVLACNDIDGTQLVQMVRHSPMTSPDSDTITLAGGLEFSPLQLEQPCTLRVIAKTEDRAFSSGKLRIALLPTPHEQA